MIRKIIKLFYTCFYSISILIILVACTKNDNNLTLQDDLQDNKENICENNTDTLIEDLVVANETIVQLVAANLDEKIYKINDISLSMMANSEFVDIVTKSNEDYEIEFEKIKDREQIVYEELFMNMYKWNCISNIVYFKEEVIDALNDPKYQESNFLEEFLVSELYEKVIENKGKPVFKIGLFNDEQVYFLRLVSNLTKPNKFAVMIIEIDRNKFFEDIPFLDNQENIKSALLDNTGQAIFDTGINYHDDNLNIKSDTEILHVKDSKSIVVNAKCSNGWTYILQQNIK